MLFMSYIMNINIPKLPENFYFFQTCLKSFFISTSFFAFLQLYCNRTMRIDRIKIILYFKSYIELLEIVLHFVSGQKKKQLRQVKVSLIFLKKLYRCRFFKSNDQVNGQFLKVYFYYLFFYIKKIYKYQFNSLVFSSIYFGFENQKSRVALDLGH